MHTIEIAEDVRYVLVTCVPGGDGEIRVEYPEERGVDADVAIALLHAGIDTAARREAAARQERARATLMAPLPRRTPPRIAMDASPAEASTG